MNKVFYKGKVFVNVIGIWQKGFAQPLWVMTNLKAEDGLAIYFQRTNIEEAFHALKNLLNLHKLMNKHQQLIDKMVTLILIAYGMILVLGQSLRQGLFAENVRKQQLYSGPFLFRKLKPEISPPIFASALSTSSHMVYPVRTSESQY